VVDGRVIVSMLAITLSSTTLEASILTITRPSTTLGASILTIT
jgi:hypothetical protein